MRGLTHALSATQPPNDMPSSEFRDGQGSADTTAALQL